MKMEDKMQNKESEQQKIILKEINKKLEEDISDLKLKKLKVKSQIHQTNELEQQKILLHELFEVMLRDSDKSMDRTLDILSHEFRTPLVPIKAYVDMLLAGLFGELTENQKEKVKILQENVSHLGNLVSNAIESKMLDSSKIVLNKTSNDISKLVIHTISNLDKKTRESGTHIYFSDKPIFALFDAKRISQVLTNLIENSIKSIQKYQTGSYFGTGKISIIIKEKDNFILVSVEDNGGGIPKEKVSKLFTKYGKVDSSSTRNDVGIGLGLHMCKQIISAHDGRIWIESQEKKGTKAYFTLPTQLPSKN